VMISVPSSVVKTTSGLLVVGVSCSVVGPKRYERWGVQ
jgi:hypothetical protein